MKPTARSCALRALRFLCAGTPAYDAFDALSAQDAGFASAMVDATLRHYPQLTAITAHLVAPKKALKPRALTDIVLLGLTQILFLATPEHAAVTETVNLTRADGHAHAAGFVNALLRRAVRERDELMALPYDPLEHWPAWLRDGAVASLTPEQMAAFLDHAAAPPAVDIYTKGEGALPESQAVAPHVCRLTTKAKIESLNGYDTGDWWVQDVASTLPVRMAGDVRDRAVLDVCAAPGGKTMQLASLGADVTAIDADKGRLNRMRDNLQRTRSDAVVICADALTHRSGPYDVVVVDAPCSATGTLRRHPELPFVHAMNRLPELTALQAKLLDHCATLLKPNGILIYAVCSVLHAEGRAQIDRFLAAHDGFKLERVDLPAPFDRAILPDGDVLMGADADLPANGFYAARLKKCKES